MENSIVLFSGPIPPPITGQAFAFSYVYKNYEEPKLLIDTNSRGGVFSKYLYYIRSIFITLYVSLISKYEVVYFTCSRTVAGFLRDMILVNVADLKGAKIINHLHGADFNDFINKLPRFIRAIADITYRKVDKSIVLLPSMKREFDRYAETMEISVVPNFYDEKFDSILDQEKSKNKDSIVLIYFSNLMFSKGVLDVITAFMGLVEAYPYLELRLAGQILGDSFMSQADLEKELSPFFKHERISYFRILQGVEKVDFLRSGDIFLLPSFYTSEAFPITIIEAMRCGLVMIVSDHNYLSEIVSKESGSIVRAKDVGQLKDEISKYLNSPELIVSKGKYNVDYASKNFPPGIFLDSVYKIIKN